MNKKITIIFFMFIMFYNIANADEWSSDFDYDTTEWEDSTFITKPINNFNTGYNSPSATYNRAKQEMEQRKILKKIHLQQKYNYKPYSPNIHQKRKTYNPKNVNWGDSWFYKTKK